MTAESKTPIRLRNGSSERSGGGRCLDRSRGEPEIDIDPRAVRCKPECTVTPGLGVAELTEHVRLLVKRCCPLILGDPLLLNGNATLPVGKPGKKERTYCHRRQTNCPAPSTLLGPGLASRDQLQLSAVGRRRR
jgi:hypothetical protein